MNELINETNNYAKFSFYFHTLFFKNMTNSFA